jgi:hypothetical protein
MTTEQDHDLQVFLSILEAIKQLKARVAELEAAARSCTCGARYRAANN